MLKLFKNSFKITNDCIIFAAPVIIFITILSYYIKIATVFSDTIPKDILSCLVVCVMSGAFLSIWLYMIKKAVNLSEKVFVFDKDRIDALFEILKVSPKGFDRYFLQFLAMCFIFLGGYYLALPLDLVHKIILLIVVVFFTLLWVPEIIYTRKNIIWAFFSAFKKIFSYFYNYIVLFCTLVILWVGVLFLSFLLMKNPFLYFFVLTLIYYFIVYTIVLLFSYYEQCYIKK